MRSLHLSTCLFFLLPLAANAQSPATRTVKSINGPEGFDVTLFAAEPMVRNPTSVVVDSRGRVWITEGRNYRLWRTEKKGTIERKPEGDQVKILEDTDGDGRADRVTVFAQDIFPAPMGLAVEEHWRNGTYVGCRVYVGNSPQLLLLEDTNGDDRADRREPLLNGFRGVDSDHGLHGMMLGLDGRLYFTVGDARYGVNNVQAETPTFDVTDRSGRRLRSSRYGTVCRVRTDGTEMEVLAHRLRNDYETCTDSYGNVFVSDNDDDGHFGCRINWILNGGNYGYRMPGTRLHSGEDLPGVVPKIAGTGNGSPAGLLVYEGDMLPKAFRNAVLEADAGTRQINAFPLHRSGAAIRTTYEVLLRGADDWFRPIDLDVAPDGSLFIADWYDAGVGGNRVSDQTTGRIYRLARSDTPYKTPHWNRKTLDGATTAIDSPNRSTQIAARRIALSHPPEKVVDHVGHLWPDRSPIERARLLGLLASIDAGRPLLLRALHDRSAAVREAALRLLAQDATRDSLVLPPGTAPPTPPVMAHWDAAVKLADDPDAGVRRELILALRHVPTDKCGALLQRLADQWNGNDRYYLEALRLSLRDREPAFVTALFEHLAEQAASSRPTDTASVAVPPFFPTYDNTAFLKPDDRLPPATATGKLAGLAWSLGRSEALAALKRAYARQIHPDERDAIEQALEQIRTPAAAKVLLERARRTDRIAEERRLLKRLAQAAGSTWTFLPKEPGFIELVDGALSHPDLQADALDVVAKLRLATFQQRLLQWLDDSKQPVERRGEILETLAQLGSRPAIDRARRWLSKESAATVDPALAASAIRALASDTKSTPMLLRLVTDPEMPMLLRRQALAQLLQRPSGARQIMKRVQANQLDEPLAKESAQQLANHPQQPLKQQARRLLSERYGQKERQIDFDRILAIQGDARRGEAVYLGRGGTPCAKCHRARGAGASIGPDLSTIGTKYGRRELLSHIVFPNRAINYNYAVTSLMLEDGRVLSGMIVRQNDTTLELATAQGEIVRLSSSDIEEKRTQATSLMPEGLLNTLSDQEVADLLAFLGTLRRPVIELGETLLAGPISNRTLERLDTTKGLEERRVRAEPDGYFALQPTGTAKQSWRLAWRLDTMHAQAIELVIDSPGTVTGRLGKDRLDLTRQRAGDSTFHRASVTLPAGPRRLVLWIESEGKDRLPIRVTLIPTRSVGVSLQGD